MNCFKTLLPLLLISSSLFWGCSSEPDSNSKSSKDPVILGKMELSDGWARPASQGKTSGAYLKIDNGTASRDTLLAVSSKVAEKAELHKSVLHKDSTISMQPAGRQIIAPGTELHLKPGELHIMLIDLKSELSTGDSLSLSLKFARVGTKKITLPVKDQN